MGWDLELITDDVTFLMGPKVAKTLLDVFLCAARLEQIPSPTYWQTLSFLSKRWRHQVNFLYYMLVYLNY